MPLANTASAAGCPLACGGRPVKPFTPIGDGMLGTAGAVMPGGVLPPACEKDTKSEWVSSGSNNYMDKTGDTPPVTPCDTTTLSLRDFLIIQKVKHLPGCCAG